VLSSAVLHRLCLIAGRKALLLSDLTAASAFRTAVTLVSLDRCNLWLRIDVCVGIIAFGPLPTAYPPASVALIPNGAGEVRVGSEVGPGVGPGVVPPSLPPTGPVILLARSSLHCKGLEHDTLSRLPSDLLAVSLKTPKAPRQCQVLGRSRRRAPPSPRSAGKWRAMAGARIR
jgi:hypothetical protein